MPRRSSRGDSRAPSRETEPIALSRPPPGPLAPPSARSAPPPLPSAPSATGSSARSRAASRREWRWSRVFCVWQRRHSACRFASPFVPPSASGFTWSTWYDGGSMHPHAAHSYLCWYATSFLRRSLSRRAVGALTAVPSSSAPSSSSSASSASTAARRISIAGGGMRGRPCAARAGQAVATRGRTAASEIAGSSAHTSRCPRPIIPSPPGGSAWFAGRCARANGDVSLRARSRPRGPPAPAGPIANHG